VRPPAIRVQAIRRTTRQPRERFLGFSGRARRGRPRCGKRSRVSTCRSCVARPLGKLRRRASGVCGTTGTTGRGAGQNHRRSPLRAQRTHAIVHTCMTHELTRIHGGRPARADRRSAQTAGWEGGSTRGFASPWLPDDHPHSRQGSALPIANHRTRSVGRERPIQTPKIKEPRSLARRTPQSLIAPSTGSTIVG